MINNKLDLKKYISEDMAFFHQYPKRYQIRLILGHDPAYQILRYLRFLRKEEYYHNARHDLLGRLLCLYYFRKKNQLGNKLGFKIPVNCFGPGLTIYHHGYVIVNEAARIGAHCRLHGNNCIGNNGKADLAPTVGDGLDLGVGACILGGVSLGNNVTIGANAVVVKTETDDSITLIGIPARKLKV